MAELIHGIDPFEVRGRLDRVRDRAGDGVEILVACKYVPVDEMGALAEAGVELVGENRLQDLVAKQERWGDAFTWDFIGAVQSRKAREIAGRVRLIHSICTDSALVRLEGHAAEGLRVLVEVDLAGEASKPGIAPAELGGFIERCPVPVAGLMTMPPLAGRAEDSRPYFARLAELAGEHRLAELSMGTSQDWPVAVEEGATIIRLGASLLRRDG